MAFDWDELITKARNGDWQAEQLWCQKSKAYLWAVYQRNRFRWGLPEDYAESIMHLTLTRAFRKYPLGGQYPSFLSTIFIYAVHDEWLRPHREETFPLDEARPEPSDPGDLEEQIITNEEVGILYECIKKLSIERKLAVELWLEGWSLEEIARRVPDRSIKDLLHHAKQELRECVEARLSGKT